MNYAISIVDRRILHFILAHFQSTRIARFHAAELKRDLSEVRAISSLISITGEPRQRVSAVASAGFRIGPG